MKFVQKGSATEYKNAASCIAHEYEMGTPDINIARVEVNGRYPEGGTAVNTEVTELVYVAAGSGIVSCNSIPTLLSEGDAVSIAPGEHIYWEGTLTLIVACSPAWHPDQYVLKDD